MTGVLRLNMLPRVNAVQSRAVNVDYMTSVLRASSVCRSQRNALCARQTGRAMTSSEKELRQPRANLKAEAEGLHWQEQAHQQCHKVAPMTTMVWTRKRVIESTCK